MKHIKIWIACAVCALLLAVGFSSVLRPAAAFASTTSGPAGGTTSGSPTTQSVCGGTGGGACNDFIDKYINPFILLFSGLVGVFAVISIIMGGIQYAASADDPGAVSKAKQRIFNTIIGLVGYLFLFAFLNYLIPGGIL